ncbi:hypothetical protein [Leucobacter denitrificans]|uniref:Uncharacterized protein n=1 Tax=Leucobacter denitrificans TaxID=683042 RepID=A0A7G9S2J5_9MICO|nr:hypothetical protein [Leucobacter denitrificans]QNN62070.1 hypothetical protein H9L06_07070 [Leucobacter denitrificans]
MAPLRKRILTSAVKATILIFGVLTLAGCLQEVPLVSEAKITTGKSLRELRTWVGEQLDAAVAASEVDEGWYDSYWHDVFWSTDRPQDRELLLSALFPGGCGGNGGRIEISLKNMTAEDPLAAAAKVRDFWKSEGWVVSDIRTYAPDTQPYFRADNEYGETLAFQASSEGMTLEVASSCSRGVKTTSWQDDMKRELLASRASQISSGSINEFKDEIERREQSDQ